MYNVLLILLHRPFVADGHLYNNARSISVNSLLTCATAAAQIVRLVRAYDASFSVRRAPYLISYSTYVSATIHVRIAAKRSSDSDAHRSLATCLAVLRLNQETNWAARRAKVIVEGLMGKLNVVLPENGNEMQTDFQPTGLNPEPGGSDNVLVTDDSASGGLIPDGFSPGLDIDAVIQSFAPGQGQGSNAGHWSADNQHFVNDGQARQMGFGDQMAARSGNGFFQGGNEAQANEGWYGPLMMPSPAYDDILFGFNGAMLDDISMQTWT